MSKIENGGTAFPRVTKFYEQQYSGERHAYLHNHVESTDGMSLRDYFAAHALAGLLAFPGRIFGGDAAKRAYQLADSMLAERSKP